MKHETRFCTAPDGVGLAYAIDGEGPPLVKASNWMTHLDYERQSPIWRHWVRELSRGRTLVRYDERGCGLSDRQFDGMPTLDTFVGDLSAVVDAAGLERFALLGLSGGGPTAIEYAVRNPERVTQLVLYGTWTRGRDRRGEGQTEQSRLLIDLIRVGWGGTVPAFRQVFSSIYIPSAGEEQKRWYDDLQQASSSGEMAARLRQSRNQTEISDTARRVTQPALVLHARQDRAVPYEEGRRLASLLPDARFVTLESDNHILQEGEPAWEDVPLGGPRVLGRRRASAHRGRRPLRAERARARGARAGGRRNEQRADRRAAVPEHPHGGAPPLERLRQAAAVGQVRPRGCRRALLAYVTTDSD